MSETEAPVETVRQRKRRFARAAGLEREMSMAARKRWFAEHPSPAKGPPPDRPWGESPEAARGAPWWAVKRLGPHGSAYHGPMFRHATEEGAEREAQFLAESWPGTVFVVLAMVSVHVVGEPEVKLGETH
jgi:hypothetical protein